MSKIFPSIIPDSDKLFVDDKYGEKELERMDGRELQSLAAKHPTEDVHGRMSADDIRDGLEGKQRVE